MARLPPEPQTEILATLLHTAAIDRRPNNHKRRRENTMARTPSTMLPLGTKAPDFSLVNVDGKTVSLSDFKGAPALLIVFMCNHCPFVKHLAGALAQFSGEYMQKGAAIVGINS